MTEKVLSRIQQGDFFLIAGPCVIESEAILLQVAETVARLAESRLNLGEIAHPIVSGLVAEVQETALVMVRSGWKALCLEEVESPQTIRIRFNTGLALPLYAGAAAKILLAFMSQHEQDKVMQGRLHAISHHGYLSKMKLRDELKKIRKERVAISCGEVHPGVVGIAVPIFSSDNQLLGGLAVAGIEERIPPERYAELTATLRVATKAISEAFDRAAGLVD